MDVLVLEGEDAAFRGESEVFSLVQAAAGVSVDFGPQRDVEKKK